jgi:hypothetical protein
MNVDSECYLLAGYFLTGDTPDAKVAELARCIQVCVDAWLENEETDREHARQHAADRAAGI